jgi:hypothetical protein
LTAGLLLLTSAGAAAQNTRSGDVVLHGRVLAADDLTPVKGAYVRASPVLARRPEQVVLTGDGGAFRFEGLPSGGSVMVRIEPPWGFVTPRRESLVVLLSGDSREHNFVLERTGAVTGRVIDETGRPVADVPLRLVRRYGGALWAASVRNITDERGQFRIFNLEPGDYFLIATPSRLTRYPEVVPRSGYADTYYPNVVTIEEARPVTVRTREDSPPLTLTLVPTSLFRVTVNVVDSTGAPLAPDGSPALQIVDNINPYFGGLNGFVSTDIMPRSLPFSTRNSKSGDGSTFVFTGVPPGEYHVLVGSKSRRERGFTRFKVRDADLSVTVRTNAGATLSGRVVVQGSPAVGGPSSSSTYVSAHRSPGTFGPWESPPPSAETAADGSFVLTGIRGPVTLVANSGGDRALVSIHRGATDITNQAMTLDGTEVIEDLEVTFATGVASLEIDVAAAAPPERPESAVVILFRNDPSSESRLVRSYKTWASRQGLHHFAPLSEAKGFGGLTFRGLLPGRYLVAAVTADWWLDPTSTAFLERLRPTATPVALVRGQTSRVSIRVMDVPQ